MGDKTQSKMVKSRCKINLKYIEFYNSIIQDLQYHNEYDKV